MTYEELVDQAEYVFIARITSAEEDTFSEFTDPGGVVAKFETVDILKGDPGDLDFLVGGSGSGDCRFPVRVGAHLLVQTNSQARLSICQGTRVAKIENEEFLEYWDSIQQYIEFGSPIRPMTTDKYGAASHQNEEYED